MPRRCWIVLAVIVCLTVLFCTVGLAGESPSAEHALLGKFPAMQARLEKNQFQAPIYLESAESEGSVRVDVYGVFSHRFEEVAEALQAPPHWCDITSLHINIKACTFKKVGDEWFLTLYCGRKYYQEPAAAYPLKLKFQVVSREPHYLQMALSADQGPLHTRDHRMTLEAAPLDDGKTFLHFSYAYSHGAMARLAIKTYFATIARDKVGFSIVPGKRGESFFIEGVRGSIERNTIRYYLAMETYLDTISFPENQRFEQRLSRWYDLTARYPRQLKEMDKPEYLAIKRREHANQVKLQLKEGS